MPPAVSSPDCAPLPPWDGGTRAFHWLLVLFVTAGWCLGHFGPLQMTLHFWCGYAVIALLAFRLVWGIAGPADARFAAFLRGPGAVLAYARTLPDRRAAHVGGHNPLGGWMVALMLLVLAAQVTTGLTLDPEDFINAGPLSEYVPEGWRHFALGWHHRLGWVLLALVCLHVAAIVFYRVWKRQDLVGPMLPGLLRRRN